MECVKRRTILHKTFGLGEVEVCEHGVMKVRFDGAGAKSFPYPAAFEKFLEAGEPDYAREVAADLATWRSAREREDAERRARAAEALRQAEVETPAPKPKRAPARKKKA